MIWANMTHDDRLSAVTKLSAEGGSGLSIAKELGTTRNAIMSFRSRYGIRSLNTKFGGHQHRVYEKKPVVARAKKIVPVEPPPDDAVTFDQLKDGMCKWPVGAMFCGLSTIDFRYCAFHQHVSRRVV
jgi:hypothetical protein